jgi:predicted RNase H-like HicB family nuclease
MLYTHQPKRNSATIPDGEHMAGSKAVTRRRFTAVIHREGDAFVALCPELEVVSEGETVDEARANLQEAVELFLETADPEEIAQRLHGEVYVTQLEVAVG